MGFNLAFKGLRQGQIWLYHYKCHGYGIRGNYTVRRYTQIRTYMCVLFFLGGEG